MRCPINEVVDALREINQAVAIALELPDDDQVTTAEEALLIPVPYEMRQFLLCVSDVVCGSIEPVTVIDAQSHTYLPEVAANAWDEGMSRELIPVCQVPDGYYAIAEDGEVLLWTQHGDSEERWESIWQWAEQIWLASAHPEIGS